MKIAIDAGHGYETKGKQTVDGMKEYEFNRSVAHHLKAELKKFKQVNVFFTHSDDRDVPLQMRTKIANDLDVHLFLSIHANAYGDGKHWNDVHGIETYIYPSRPKEAEKLAKKIQRELVLATGRKDRGVKTANFHVLRETKMTAVLCECGFMTNQQEAALLKSESYRQTCAKALARSIQHFYQLEKKTATQPTNTHLYKVQVGAFTKLENAERLANELKQKGYSPFITKASNQD
ncbi:N-acetylmuramoyl-L-alanine amidase [Bacillus sp. FJAT-47783]|uniref:N-acetylmuramoyl-L-alanine amidase n=1 Tax=Bacillus sp. FJAT-47783 TaxID=2922712 RepID=UPI001FAC72D3|nr:N-acetylmuramoyl-L-alanine amidase [Bacillus sp. FJAT-47783]